MVNIDVTPVNDAPVITSNGGGVLASVSVAENTSAVTTVTATDVDGPATIYSISGGADALKFTINASTGALTFISAPNFEAPTDTGANNIYDVVVRASDGDKFDDQSIAVTVTDVVEQVAANIGFVGGTAEFPGGTSTGTDVVGKFVAYDANGAVIEGATFTTSLNRSDLLLSTDGTLTANGFNNSLATNFTVTSGSIIENVHFETGGNNGDLIGETSVAGVPSIDILLGLNGTDTLSGGGNDDALFGGSNNKTGETLNGGAGNDFLSGGGDGDVLIGGAGADTMRGGGDADVFKWDLASDSKAVVGTTTYFDKILDFVSGVDKLDLSGIDANTATPGTNDAFLIRTDGTAGANSLWYTTTGTTTTVFGDTDGNLATFEFQVILDNTPLIVPTDFLP